MLYNENCERVALMDDRPPETKMVVCRLMDEAKVSRDLAFRILVELYGGEMPKFEDEPAECMQAALLKCERAQTDVREALAQIQNRLCGEP